MFFFKQKTAYEMRISDWSSDVCSSDLEAAGEAGFDDLVAYTQIKLPSRPKLELARNYWDEMGRGNAKGMHGPMLGDMAATMAVEPRIERTVWESLAHKSEEHTSEPQELMCKPYAVFCL